MGIKGRRFEKCRHHKSPAAKGDSGFQTSPLCAKAAATTQRTPQELVGVGVGLQVSGEPVDCNIKDREQEMEPSAHDTTREE